MGRPNTDATAVPMIADHAFVHNLSRGYYKLGSEARNGHLRVADEVDELAPPI